MYIYLCVYITPVFLSLLGAESTRFNNVWYHPCRLTLRLQGRWPRQVLPFSVKVPHDTLSQVHESTRFNNACSSPTAPRETAATSSSLFCEKINRLHTRTQRQRTTPPTPTHTHTTRTTPQTPKRTPPINHLTTLEGGATTVRATSHAKGKVPYDTHPPSSPRCTSRPVSTTSTTTPACSSPTAPREMAATRSSTSSCSSGPRLSSGVLEQQSASCLHTSSLGLRNARESARENSTRS